MLAPLVTGYKHVGHLLKVGVGAGEYPHLIGGYIKYTEELTDHVLHARATTSTFWFLCDSVRMANAYTIGGLQQAIVNITRHSETRRITAQNHENDQEPTV
jgi:hypothetical protein